MTMRLPDEQVTILIWDRKDPVNELTQFAYEVSPIMAWAWLHTLRTGERHTSPAQIDQWAMEELTRWKQAELAKPKGRPTLAVVKKLRSEKRKDDGPSVA